MMAPTQTHAAGEILLPLVDLNRERREERRGVLRCSRRYAASILLTAALAVTVPLPLTLHVFALHRECQKTEHQAKGRELRLQSLTADSGELDAKVGQWTQLAQSQQSRLAWAAMLPSLAACLPEDVSLQQVAISQKDKAAQVQMQGAAQTMAGLRAFTAALAHSSVFAHLHLDETTTGATGVSFQITGSLSGTTASRAEPSAP